MRRAWRALCTGWLYAVAVSASSNPEAPSSEEAFGEPVGKGVSGTGRAGYASQARAAEPSRSSATKPPALSPYQFLQQITREGLDPADASSDEWTQEDLSASEDGWSNMAELLEDEVLSDGERLCVPANFLTPAGSLQAISGAPELLGAFESFMQHKTTGNRKLLVFMTSGTGEELVGNRRISQRMVPHPTVHKKRPGFWNSSEGVAELSDDGHQQAEVLHDILQSFASLIKSLAPEKRQLACFDAFLVSTLQCGVETSLKAFSGLLDTLACHPGKQISQVQQDGYMCSSVRLVVAPHLREVVETESDIGECMTTVLKKTKALRVHMGYQRDIFDCALTTFGLRWRKQQLGAVWGPSFEQDVAWLQKATPGGDLQAAESVLRSLDKFAYPRNVQCYRRESNLQTTVAFLKEAVSHEPLTQRAVWTAPEEMDPDSVESEASVLRRGLALLRVMCSVPAADKFMLVTHRKFFERLTGQAMDNGELMGFSLDCSALRDCIFRAGLRPWEDHPPPRSRRQQAK